MFSFLVTLAVVYVVKAAWPKLTADLRDQSPQPMDWAWPYRLLVVGWNKLFGANSVFDKKEDENE